MCSINRFSHKQYMTLRLSMSTEELATDSDYTGSFIASDDDLEEGLTWDSEDSRPPGPSPESPSSFIGPPNLRTRLQETSRRRVYILADSPSDSSSQVSSSILDSLSPRVNTVMLQEENSSRDYDSDSTYVQDQPRSPQYSPSLMLPHSPVDSDDEFEIIGDVPHSPDYSPPGSQQDESEEVIEIQSSPPAHPVDDLLPPPAPTPPPDVITAPKPPVVEETAKLDISILSEGDDGSLCSICMDPLTNSGKHRVVCLRCGHIFGQSCVERWIKVGCNNGARRCPTCNKKACLKDIRVLYLPKVVPLDTSERDRLLQEKEELAAQKKVIESDLTRTLLQQKLIVERYEERIKALEKRLLEVMSGELSQSQQQGVVVLVTQDVSPDGGCRVMAFNHRRQELVVSQPSGNTIFAGFGVRVLNSVDWQPSRYVLLHSKMVRDLAFHSEDRDLLLSASLDQTAKLVDLASATTVHTFKGEGPLWSCCWDMSHPHLLLLGSQTGKVCQYDRRMMDHYVNLWVTDNNFTPVVALSSTPSRANTPFPQGGFLMCRLNAIYAYPRHGVKYGCQELPLEGPFMSMKYDLETQTLLTVSRPSSRSSHSRVCLSLLDSDSHGQVSAPLIHTFNCGSSARVMSRSTVLPHFDDSLVVAHNESGRTLDFWSSKSGDRSHSVPLREPIIDLAPLPLSNHKAPLLAALSEKKLTIYRVN